jgi:hypothetical protein
MYNDAMAEMVGRCQDYEARLNLAREKKIGLHA